MTAQTFSPAAQKAYQQQVVADFRANHGKLGGHFAGAPVMLLTTTGARSGQPHTTPVTYTRDGSRFVIIAASGGAPADPDWFRNLVAHPRVTVETGEQTFAAIAHVTEGAERQRLFDRMAAQRPNFIEFQRQTTRQLPVVVLERVLDQTTDYVAFNRDFIAEFHANQGNVGGMFTGLPVLLLTTTGAKSGQPRVAPVLYARDGDRYLIVASKGGSPANPAWYFNLLANPEVTVDLGTETFPARATVAAGAERERLFTHLAGVLPGLEKSQASTSRQLPIIVLERLPRAS